MWSGVPVCCGGTYMGVVVLCMCGVVWSGIVWCGVARCACRVVWRAFVVCEYIPGVCGCVVRVVLSKKKVVSIRESFGFSSVPCAYAWSLSAMIPSRFWR